jgi:hypothetical protein
MLEATGNDFADVVEPLQIALPACPPFTVCPAGCNMQAVFEQTDQLGLEVLQQERQYDAATCMFALHYFFERESSLMKLMETVAANLKPGATPALMYCTTPLAISVAQPV